jgi:hypothetical protein
MIEDSRKKYEKEYVLIVSFLDEDGTPIANSTQASLLTRLSNFQISINGGERIYNCINTRFIGNTKLEKPIVTQRDPINLKKVEKLIFRENLSFTAALALTNSKNSQITHKKNIKYSTILKDYVSSKYSMLEEFHTSIKERREKRIQKFLNLFFYACLAQSVTLNLCTFVFFSWDFMEPITQCITYLNIIVGYYYWAITSGDYEIESMVYWIRARKFLFKPALTDCMMQEKEEIENLLKEDQSIHYH